MKKGKSKAGFYELYRMERESYKGTVVKREELIIIRRGDVIYKCGVSDTNGSVLSKPKFVDVHLGTCKDIVAWVNERLKEGWVYET